MVYLQFERYFEMFTILAILILGTVKVECEQIQCQMIPIKTENGLTGHCCVYSKDAVSERKKERIVEQIFKSPQLINGKVNQHPGKVKLTESPLDIAERSHRNNVEKNTVIQIPKKKEELDFRYSGNLKLTERPLHVPGHNEHTPTTVSPQRNNKIRHPTVSRPNKPVLPPKLSGENFPMFERTTIKSSSTGHMGESSTSEIYASSTEETSTISGIKGNGTTVQVDNRFNIGSPKVCNGSTKKTSNGECETPFG